MAQGRHVASGKRKHKWREARRALSKCKLKSDKYFFNDIDGEKTDFLRDLCGDRQDVEIHTGDSNEYLINTILPKIEFKKFNRALCLLDPYALHLDCRRYFNSREI